MKSKKYAILGIDVREEGSYFILDEVNVRIAIGGRPKGKKFIEEIQYNGIKAYVVPLGFIIEGNPYEMYNLVPTKIIDHGEDAKDSIEIEEIIFHCEDIPKNEEIDKLAELLLDRYREDVPEKKRLEKEWNKYINNPLLPLL